MAIIDPGGQVLGGYGIDSYRLTPAVADPDGILEAYTDDGAEAEFVTADLDGQPDVPRNITATAGGTAADIAAVQVVVTGTNINDEEITETLPAFTENSAGTVVGSKAFKTVTGITIPAHDGTGATTAIGFGDKLQLPLRSDRNTVLRAFLDGTQEGTAPTVTASATAWESNTVELDTTLDGNEVVIDFYRGG